MRLAALVALVAALSACTPSFSEHPTAEEVLGALDKPWIGRAGIEESFLQEDSAEEDILAGICTASPQWIEVARRMDDTSNAHWGEEMSSALSVALTKQPKTILEGFEYMCHEPEDDLPASCAVPHWRAAALAALKTVNEPALTAKRDQCAIDVARSVGPQSIEEAQ